MSGVVEGQNRQGRPAIPPQPRGPPSIARLREPIDREKVHPFIVDQDFFNVQGSGKFLSEKDFSAIEVLILTRLSFVYQHNLCHQKNVATKLLILSIVGADLLLIFLILIRLIFLFISKFYCFANVRLRFPPIFFIADMSSFTSSIHKGM